MPKKSRSLRLALFYIIMTAALLTLAACGKGDDIITKLGDTVRPNSFSTTGSNTVIHQAQNDAPDDALLFIINDPTDDEMEELLSYQLLKADPYGSHVLLAPRRQNSVVQLYALSYDETTEKAERGELLWNTDSSDEGLIINAEMQRGEAGRPAYEVYIESGGNYGSYFFEQPADGAEPPHFEYLLSQGKVVKIQGLD